ncbi:hypothetical protein JCM17478_27170 [Thermopirellula anaerolimosa]
MLEPSLNYRDLARSAKARHYQAAAIRERDGVAPTGAHAAVAKGASTLKSPLASVKA